MEILNNQSTSLSPVLNHRNIVLRKVELIGPFDFYPKFRNWVIGEFDLSLKDENPQMIKVYFPNGWFSTGYLVKKWLMQQDVNQRNGKVPNGL